MIQLLRATSLQFKLVYLNLYDEMTNADYIPLITITSQLTGNSKTFLPASANYVNKDRYVSLLIYSQQIASNENLSAGSLFFGDTDFPLGFYNVTIYQNSSNVNLNPSGLTTIYTGLMNVRSNSTTDPVTYTEYTTNDSDTESVYITI
jgi:hypothetical protein|tara:strand:+ start:241 stop:684 length:444 start_codon:yes stop_codon:yes gene_type:complete